MSIFVRLLNSEGSLLAFSGFGGKDASAAGAIASNIWTSFQKSGQLSLDDSKLDCVLVECKVFKLRIKKIFLLKRNLFNFTME